jgi:hypothetical protein
MRSVLVVVLFLLLAGCASPKEPTDSTDGGKNPAAAALASPAPVPLRFAAGNFEALNTFKKTFQPTDICTFQCNGAGIQRIDLTPFIPANAPVEISVTTTSDGSVDARLDYKDAQPVRQSRTGGQGGADVISALVTRADSGAVELILQREFGFRGATPVDANVEVRSVVRADVLAAGVPAAVNLAPGAVINFTGEDVDQAVLLLPNGEILRDVVAPFSFTVPNGTSGESVLMVVGGDANVVGPNVTMTAKRVAMTVGSLHPVQNGAPTKWDFSTEKTPLLVGVAFARTQGVSFISVAALGPYSIKVTAPGNVPVIERSSNCNGIPLSCANTLFFAGSTSPAFSSQFLGEYLKAGTYSVEIAAQQATGYSAYEYVLNVI